MTGVDVVAWSVDGEQVGGSLVELDGALYAVRMPLGRVEVTRIGAVIETAPRLFAGAARAAIAARLATTRHWTSIEADMWQAWDQLEREESLYDNPTTTATPGQPGAPRPSAPVHSALRENFA